MAKLWVRGGAYRIAGGLNQLNTQLRVYAPRAVPPATPADSWGALADDEHAKTSDHYPHFLSVLGLIAVVLARDFPHAPKLGLNGGVVTEHLRRQRDPRIRYIIFNRRITGVNYGWTWHPFTGDDPHDTHFHVSAVHDVRADATHPWSLPGTTPVAQPIKGTGVEIFTVTLCPPGGKDVTGKSLTEGGQYFVTPDGLFSLTGNEFFSQPAAIQPNRMAMTYPRVLALCAAFAPEPIDVAALAEQIAAHYPQSEIDQAMIVAALSSDEGQAQLEAAAFAGAQRAETA